MVTGLRNRKGDGARVMLNPFDHALASMGQVDALPSIDVDADQAPIETDHLMTAWYLEYRRSTEYELLLDRARRLLERILSEDEITPANRRRTRAMLAAIRAIKRALQEEVG
jgi:hypothetical protein